MKAEKMAVDIQDGRKPQDTLAIKRQKTQRFSLLGDTRPNNGHRRYIKHACTLPFTNHLLVALGRRRWPDKRLSKWAPARQHIPSKPRTFHLHYLANSRTCILGRTTACERAPPGRNVARGGQQPPRFTCRAALHIHDPMSCLGSSLSGQSLEGLEATKGIGAGRRWAPEALIGGVEPHDHY